MQGARGAGRNVGSLLMLWLLTRGSKAGRQRGLVGSRWSANEEGGASVVPHLGVGGYEWSKGSEV